MSSPTFVTMIPGSSSSSKLVNIVTSSPLAGEASSNLFVIRSCCRCRQCRACNHGPCSREPNPTAAFILGTVLGRCVATWGFEFSDDNPCADKLNAKSPLFEVTPRRIDVAGRATVISVGAISSCGCEPAGSHVDKIGLTPARCGSTLGGAMVNRGECDRWRGIGGGGGGEVDRSVSAKSPTAPDAAAGTPPATSSEAALAARPTVGAGSAAGSAVTAGAPHARTATSMRPRTQKAAPRFSRGTGRPPLHPAASLPRAVVSPVMSPTRK